MKAFIFAFAILFSIPAVAGSLEEGLQKYQKKDFEAAYQILKPYADAGEPEAQKITGSMIWMGQGVAKNRSKACDYIEQSAKSDDPEAYGLLGLCYLEETWREPDPQKAHEFLGKASDKGFLKFIDIEASVAFQIGEYPSAFGYYAAASSEGDYHAMIMLGAMYRDGLYPKQNHKKACDLFERALPSKDPTALHNFGDCLYFGLDRPVDKEGAYPYFKEAADLGSEKSKSAAEAIYKELYGAKSH